LLLRPRARRLLATSFLTVLTVVVLAGCANDRSDDGDASAAAPAARDESSGGRAANGNPASASETTAPTVDLAQAQVPGEPREIVYTAQVDVRVRDVDDALDAANGAVDDAGGRVFEQRSDLGQEPTITATYKVPPARFDELLDAISKLGRVRERTVDSSDVTGQVVDLEARIRATRTSVERLQALLAQSGSVGDLLTAERELVTREGQLEALEGQLATLRAQVDQATITAVFTSRAAPAAAKPGEPTKLPGFLSGLRTGAQAFGNTATVVGGVFGFALPFLLVAVVVAVPYFVLRRRHRHAEA
jgi:hypothetical protein